MEYFNKPLDPDKSGLRVTGVWLALGLTMVWLGCALGDRIVAGLCLG